jgi:hypothetical protein
MYSQNIENLLSKTTYYLITTFNKIYDEKSSFELLEDYFLSKCIDTYIDKLTFSIFKIITSHKYYIELTEIMDKTVLNYNEYEDISNFDYIEISDIIKTVIKTGASSLNIFLYNSNSLITLSDQSAVVFSDDEDLLKDIKNILEIDGLHFLKKEEEV